MNLISETIVESLLDIIPEIRPYYDKEMELWTDSNPGLHNVFGNVLNPFLLDAIDSDGLNKDSLLCRIFNFLEKMAISNDEQVVNVLMATVLERIGDDVHTLKTSYQFMGPNTKRLSDVVEKGLGRKR